MLESVRRCDLPVKRRGVSEPVPCGERVPDDSPTAFSLDGASYEGDLCDEHKGQLQECLAPFIAMAREIRNPTRASNAVRGALKGKSGKFTTKDVRLWLQEQGKDVSPSGRLPNELIEDYKAAHHI